MKTLKTKIDDRQFLINQEADKVFDQLIYAFDKIKEHVNTLDFFGVKIEVMLLLLRVEYDNAKPECLEIIRDRFYKKYSFDDINLN